MATSQCFENPPSLSSTCGSGNLQEIGGLKTYVTGPHDSKLAILLISDVFGYEAPNLRKLADKVAAEGFLVVVPDFLYGEPLDSNNPNTGWDSWIKAHGMDKGFEDAKPVISALRSKGVTSIGAAGFCWGGVVVVKLARTDDIQAAVLLHPGPITEDEIKEVKCPISILGAEIDRSSPPEKLKQFGEILSAKPGIDSFVKIFPGVSHGWSVRYDLGDESAVKSAEESHGDMLSWFINSILASVRWIRPEVYPIFAAVGTVVGICSMQLVRNICTNPEVRVNRVNRAAGILDNFEEGERYAEHRLRKFVQGRSFEITPSLNKFFTDPK